MIHANRRLGYFPGPNAYRRARRGRPAPLWKRSTVWAAADSRPGMGGGHPTGPSGLLARARDLDAEHRAETGRPISRDTLCARLRIGRDKASALVAAVRAEAAAGAAIAPLGQTA